MVKIKFLKDHGGYYEAGKEYVVNKPTAQKMTELGCAEVVTKKNPIFKKPSRKKTKTKSGPDVPTAAAVSRPDTFTKEELEAAEWLQEHAKPTLTPAPTETARHNPEPATSTVSQPSATAPPATAPKPATFNRRHELEKTGFDCTNINDVLDEYEKALDPIAPTKDREILDDIEDRFFFELNCLPRQARGVPIKAWSKIGSWTPSQVWADFSKWLTIQPLPKLEEGEVPADILKILKDPNLLQNLIKELDKKVTGEERNKKAVIIQMLGGRLVINASTTSSNLTINSESGSGKDWLISHTLQLLPDNLWEHKKRITEKALSYLHCKEREPRYTWDGKVLYLEDVSSTIFNSSVVKVFSSSHGGVTSFVEDGVAKSSTIVGKPFFIATAARLVMDEEMLRRFPLLNLDESKKATREITKNYAKQQHAGGSIDYDPKIVQSQLHLKRVEVYNPFVIPMSEVLPSEGIIWRTIFPRWDDYVKFSAALFQHQRKRDSRGKVIAEDADYENGTAVFMATLQNVQGLPITRLQQEVIKAVIKACDRLVKDAGDVSPPVVGQTSLTSTNDEPVIRRSATIVEIEREATQTSKYLYEVLNSLHRFLDKTAIEGANKKKVLAWQVKDDYANKPSLPLTVKELNEEAARKAVENKK